MSAHQHASGDGNDNTGSSSSSNIHHHSRNLAVTPSPNRMGVNASDSNNTIMTAQTDVLHTPSTASLYSPHRPPLDAAADPAESAPLHDTPNNTANSAHKKNPASPAGRRLPKLTQLHRIVEQENKEPMFVIIVKWIIIIVGLGMLVAVTYFMGDVIYEWFSGALKVNNLGEHSDDRNVTEMNSSRTDVDIP